MRKRFLLILLAVVLVTALIFSGCKPAPKGPEEIIIGSSAMVTGMYAGFGESAVFGYRAAVEDINKLGGIYLEEYGTKLPVRFIAADNESDTTKVGTLAEDLILRDNVQFLLTPPGPPTVQAPVATVADRHKIPHIVAGNPLEPWLGMRQEVTPPWEYSWSIGFAIVTPAPAGDFRYGLSGFTIKDTWLDMLNMFGGQTNKKAGVFASDDADGVAWYSLFPQVLEEWGADVLGEERKLGLFPMETTDYTSMIEEWKDYGCEILWGNCPAPHFGTMWRQCHALGFQPKMVFAGRAALFYVDANSWGGDLPQGIGTEIWWSSSYQIPGFGDTTPQSLTDRWTEATGQPFNPSVGASYATVQILVDAIERAGTLDPEAVNKAIGETDLMTMIYRVKFDEDQYSRYPLIFGQWQKTDKPWVWELPIVLSKHDFLPVQADPIFPIPYD